MNGRLERTYTVLVGDLRESYHLEDTDSDESIILKLIFNQWNWEGMDWIDLAQDRGQVPGACKCDHKPSASINTGNFLTS
jgi:hypothetical protein